jgi:hypothetical protein
MKTVLFLGAGFSRAWGLPVMQEFFHFAKISKHIKQQDKDFLRDLQAKAQKGVSMLQVHHHNLEEILSFCLASESFNAGYPTESDSRYSRLCHILHKVYRHIDLKQWRERQTTHLSNLRRLLGIRVSERPTGHDLSLITTNYDIMAELCMVDLGMHCTLPGKWSVVQPENGEAVTGILYELNGYGPLLCKLHGSLNWFVGQEAEGLVLENSILPGDFIDSSHEHIHPINIPKVSYSEYEPIATPLIVPPTLFKMQTAPYFRQIWNAAGKALQEAEKLVFLGFSFPESDTYIKYFLAANLYENVDLTTIDIVDPNANRICNRLAESNFGIHFKDRLNPVNEKWEEVNYSLGRLD